MFELVFAVDGSTDGTVEWLEDQAQTDGRIVVLDLANRGAAAARQAGVEAARGDVILLMDDDVVAEPGLVAGHARHHGDGVRRLVLGYMPNDWESLPRGRRGIGLLYRRAYERQCERYARDPEFVLQRLWAGNFSLPREDFLRLEPASIAVEREEDREFGIRCLKAGLTGYFDRKLAATHEYSRSLEQYRRDCHQAGQARQRTYVTHAELLGEDLEIGHSLPGPLRRLMPALASRRVFPLVAAVLDAVFAAGARLGLTPVEAFAARGLGSLEVQRGATEAAHAVTKA
jgi:glycosyltransferase involved in cell wall biosynthesis